MPLSLTALYAAILALMIVALGINVTVHRAKFSIPLGDGGNAEMFRMIRLHGNAIEYLPLALILMFAYELNACRRPGACGRRRKETTSAPPVRARRGSRSRCWRC